MSDRIHPITPPPGGTVPAGLAPYQAPRRRLRRIGAAVAAGLALTAGGVAIAQAPVHGTHVATVFTATQSQDDDTTVPAPPQKPERAHAAVGERGDD
jgi:hypothetical protein